MSGARIFDWIRRHKPTSTYQESPLVLIGIGNPGARYANTRHNVGFMCIELLSSRWNIRLNDKRKDVVLGQTEMSGKKIVLAEPRTFVNRSGLAARYLATRFGTKPADMLILVDDLDLPVGSIRIRKSGGSGGHNGLNSITRELDTQQFPRLRFGISRPEKGAIQHVLGGFTEDELTHLNDAFKKAMEAIEVWIEDGIDHAMNRFN